MESGQVYLPADFPGLILLLFDLQYTTKLSRHNVWNVKL